MMLKVESLDQFENEKEIRKKEIPPRSAAIGIRSNDIVERVAYISWQRC